jgi:diguanylate cyclase (GGDEF)-like protein/PAS domain S-box-containing protein
MTSLPPPSEAEEQDSADFLSTQFVFGTGGRPTVGLDVLVTKVALDFVALTSETGDNSVKRNLDALREATGVDAICIALLDAERRVIERVASATGLLTQFDPQVLKGELAERLPVLTARLEHLRLAELRDTRSPRREHAVDAARLAELNVRSAVVCGLSLNDRVCGFIALFSSQPRPDGWDANLHLMLKLVGSSFASGLERLRVQRYLARLEERNALSLPAANDGLWDFDVENNTVYFSPRWRTMLGYDEHDPNVSPDWRRLVHPDDMARVQALIREHIAGKIPMFESVHRMRHCKGDWRWVVSRAKARVDGTGRLRRLVGVEFDITERKLYEDALFKEKESAQITLQSIGDGVITTDGHREVEYLNPTAEELTGWKFEEAQGKNIDEIFRGFHEETCEPLENPLSVAMRMKRAIKVRPTLLIKRDGTEMYIESTASPIRDGAGAVCGGVLVFRDVSESRELNRKLSYHASHDILTGLVNRREFEARLERSLRSAKARETQYALCHLDVDQFKIINDSCGHSAGDALLGQVGALLKTKIRWRDTLARLGGDEFGVLLESCTVHEALDMAEQLRETIRNYKFVWEDRTFRLGCSIGVVPLTGDSDDVAAVLSAADSACQLAKEAGRNRVYSFEDNDIDLMRRRREMQWAAKINNALEESRFELFRMKILPLQGPPDTGEHYELLLRMRDEQGKIVPPTEFIKAAEKYGITPQIDRWVVEHALQWLVSEADERERLSMCSINLSGQSFTDAEFLPFVQTLLRNSGIDGTKICFEITETTAIQSFAQANRFITALKKEHGCKFALDDFGTGHSSFGYLKHFPVDYLKIDGSFVKEILRNDIDCEMVRSINQIGHLTGKKTIAEFAETPEVIEKLRSLGVDYAQGYGVKDGVPTRIVRVAALG